MAARDGFANTVFLSTLSLRRATALGAVTSPAVSRFLSTLSLRRATAVFQHAVVEHFGFLSTLSLRRATSSPPTVAICQFDFYPRSPCGERHHESVRGKHCSSYFYPRSPCGERQFPAGSSPRRVVLFLSTLSLRRATYNSGWRECYRRISIHALLAESDILPLFWHLLL